uniref:Uncharacterized protein n=1 Tax=Anguilla anguilla TaxID=7936 RepID=A0A0E9UAT8_ANGAN
MNVGLLNPWHTALFLFLSLFLFVAHEIMKDFDRFGGVNTNI